MESAHAINFSSSRAEVQQQVSVRTKFIAFFAWVFYKVQWEVKWNDADPLVQVHYFSFVPRKKNILFVRILFIWALILLIGLAGTAVYLFTPAETIESDSVFLTKPHNGDRYPINKDAYLRFKFFSR
jgi:hypothetical protein